MGRGWLSLAVVACVAVLTAGCTRLQEVSPTEPTASLAPLAIPVILPKPTPTPKPAPTPTPAAPSPSNPTPAPPSASSCSLPASNPSHPACDRTTPALLGKLEKAITAATQARPDLFDFSNKRCDNCYLVKNEAGYFAEVQRQLAAQGVCSLSDADEIGLKSANSNSEWYDIYLASGHIRRGEGAYRYSCSPANF
jgi:hypothetical protein